MEIIAVLITVSITWYLLHLYLYSPKAQIKKLWKIILGEAFEIGKIKNIEYNGDLKVIYEGRMRRAGNLINAIIDFYYHHPESDEEKEYISKNKYPAN